MTSQTNFGAASDSGKQLPELPAYHKILTDPNRGSAIRHDVRHALQDWMKAIVLDLLNDQIS